MVEEQCSSAYDTGYAAGFAAGEAVKQGNIRIHVRIVTRNPAHTTLSVWVNGGLVTNPGAITLRSEEVEPFLARLAPNSIENEYEIVLNRPILFRRPDGAGSKNGNGPPGRAEALLRPRDFQLNTSEGSQRMLHGMVRRIYRRITLCHATKSASCSLGTTSCTPRTRTTPTARRSAAPPRIWRIATLPIRHPSVKETL